MPVSYRNAVLRHAQGWLTLVKWLLPIEEKMFVRLSLVFIPSPDVTQCWCFCWQDKLLAQEIVKSDNDVKTSIHWAGSILVTSRKTFSVSIEKDDLLCSTDAIIWGNYKWQWMIIRCQSSSLQRMERLSPTSYHLCGQTIKRVFGGAVCSGAHQSLTQLESDGRWEAQQKTNQVEQLTGWMESLLTWCDTVLELLAC